MPAHDGSAGLCLMPALSITRRATAPPGFASEAIADSPNAPHEERILDDYHQLPDFLPARNRGRYPAGAALLPALGQGVVGMSAGGP